MEMLSATIIAALGGLGYLAYRHPEWYANFGRPLAWSALGITLFSFAYVSGINAGMEMVAENSSMLVNGRYTFYGHHWLLPFVVLGAVTACLFFFLLLKDVKSKNPH